MLRDAGWPCACSDDPEAYGWEHRTKSIVLAGFVLALNGCDRTLLWSLFIFYSDLDCFATVHVLEKTWVPGIMHWPICQVGRLLGNSGSHDKPDVAYREVAVYL